MHRTDSLIHRVGKTALRSSASDLASWKEIAAYLNRTTRTVQRWERLEGLPVRRHTHRKGSTVFAHKQEIDHWLESRGCAKLAENAAPEIAEPVLSANAMGELLKILIFSLELLDSTLNQHRHAGARNENGRAELLAPAGAVR